MRTTCVNNCDLSVSDPQTRDSDRSVRWIPGLDGLRAMSVMAVLCGHFFFPDRGGGAALGVYIFFAISGFLITRLLFLELAKNGRVSISAFYCRRFFRLYPILFVYVLVVCVIRILQGEGVPSVEVAGVFLYYINYLMSWRAMDGESLILPFGVLWSLAVEEHFYLLMPVFFVFSRGSPRKMVFFSLSIIVFSLLMRFAYVFVEPDVIGKLITYRNSDTRIDSIAFGVLISGLCETNKGRSFVRFLSSTPSLVLGFVIMLLAAMYPGELYKETIKFSLISFGVVPLVCSMVFGAQTGWLQRLANTALVVWIGRLSYSLYVWHGGVVFLLLALGVDASTLQGAGLLKMAFVFFLAIVSYLFVERPVLAIGHRLSSRLQHQG